MKDWSAPLELAAEAAKKAAKTPLVSAVLEISSKDEVLPFSMSDEAAARLLDIAVLCGNSQAAANLAKTCSVRPLRRWRGDELCLRDDLPVLSAALCAGAEFQDLNASQPACGECVVEIPLLLAVALDFDLENWQQLGHFFRSTSRWPGSDVGLGYLFLSWDDVADGQEIFQIDTKKVKNGLRSGWDLKYIWEHFDEGIRDHTVGLLDSAILSGDSDCADALATAGVQLREDCSELLKRVCRGESVQLEFDLGENFGVGLASECQSAAFASARASLRRLFKREGSKKGAALYQVLINKFYPRDVPMALVHDILVFSMEAPKILDQLDLWDEVRGWTTCIAPKTTFAEHVGYDDAEELREDSGRHYAPQ